MRLMIISLVACLMQAAVTARSDERRPAQPETVDHAVELSVSLIQKSLGEYPKHETCFSCHHQGVGTFALTIARSRGYAVDDATIAAAVKHTRADLHTALESYRKGEGQPGAVTRAGYALLAFQAGGGNRDETTAAVATYLLQRDKDRDFWRHTSSRPPQEASSFTDTFLAARAIRKYCSPDEQAAVKTRLEKARMWLVQAAPKETEDRVFQLWALRETGADRVAIKKSVDLLVAEQQPDGGWAQLPGGKSDAYATGSVMTALRQAGGVSESNSAFGRGVQYLLSTQLPDGSWHVVSRSKPFQPYFETGFPHGTDQFISMAATGWATAALALSGRKEDNR